MHKVCTLGRGIDGPAKSVLDPMGGGSTVSVRASYFFAGSLQNRIKESIQNIPFHVPRIVKKRKLDPRVLLGVLIRYFPIALYSSFFNL